MENWSMQRSSQISSQRKIWLSQLRKQNYRLILRRKLSPKLSLSYLTKGLILGISLQRRELNPRLSLSHLSKGLILGISLQRRELNQRLSTGHLTKRSILGMGLLSRELSPKLSPGHLTNGVILGMGLNMQPLRNILKLRPSLTQIKNIEINTAIPISLEKDLRLIKLIIATTMTRDRDMHLDLSNLSQNFKLKNKLKENGIRKNLLATVRTLHNKKRLNPYLGICISTLTGSELITQHLMTL